MSTEEFSNEFDVLYNNIMGGANVAPGLDEYEKSVFLTKAQDEILKSYFTSIGNRAMAGIDDTPRRQLDFSRIVKTEEVDNILPSKLQGFEPRGINITTLECEPLMILNEQVTVNRNNKPTLLTVIPITYTEYDRLMSKPFKRPLKNQAWRLISYNNNLNIELVVGPGDTVSHYSIRYLKRPNPIILAYLDGLTINDIGTKTECELDPIIHKEILQRAVELAKAAYVGDLASQVSLGTASQTEMGVPQTNNQRQ